MAKRGIKTLLVAVFSLFCLAGFAQEPESPLAKAPKEKMDAGEIILDHVKDAHEFHFFTLKNEEDSKKSTEVSLPLPVILYSSGKGFNIFLSSSFHHGEEVYNGYRLLEPAFIKEHGLDTLKDAKKQPLYEAGKIYAADANGMPLLDAKVYDFSLTKNVTQMLVALILLLILMLSIGPVIKINTGATHQPKFTVSKTNNRRVII